MVRDAYEAFARRDSEALIALADPEIEIHAVTQHLAGREEPYCGHAGIEEYLEDVDQVWDEIRLRPQQFIELSGNRVLVMGRVRSRRGTTQLDVPNAWLWQLADGKVKLVRLFVDAEAVGVLLAERLDLAAS